MARNGEKNFSDTFGRFGSRFAPLADDFEPVRRPKRTRHSTDHSPSQPMGTNPNLYKLNVDIEEVKKLPQDEKLNFIIESIANIGLMKTRIDGIEAQVYLNCATHDVLEERVRLLEYKTIELKARHRECNLSVLGIPESKDENCIDKIETELLDHLKLPCGVSILRAYRLGRVLRPIAPQLQRVTKQKPRAILLTMSNCAETDLILSCAHNLRGTQVSISRDYPKEIGDARKVLWPDYKNYKKELGAKNVQIKFPAALVVNNRVIKDMFPGWHEVLRGSRDSKTSARISEALKKRCDSAQRLMATYLRPTEEESSLSDALDLENEIMSVASQDGQNSKISDDDESQNGSDKNGAHVARADTRQSEAPLNPLSAPKVENQIQPGRTGKKPVNPSGAKLKPGVKLQGLGRSRSSGTTRSSSTTRRYEPRGNDVSSKASNSHLSAIGTPPCSESQSASEVRHSEASIPKV